MTTWAVGDIQGCYQDLRLLINKIGLEPCDTIYFVGDLINRGADNVGTLQLIRDLPNARALLGNHDLHFLAVEAGFKQPNKKDTITDLLAHPEREGFVRWLRSQPLVIYDVTHNRIFSHAGIPHIWSPEESMGYASEVQHMLRSSEYRTLLANMYGNEPARWHPGLAGWDRYRSIINYLTRMRFVDKTGTLELTHKRDIAPPGFSPWFNHPRRDDLTILFGHWEALDGNTGTSQFVALDTGCVWGRQLTAVRLDKRRPRVIQVEGQ